MLVSMHAARRRREEREARERRREQERWWATATDEEKAAWRAEEAERVREFNRAFPRLLLLVALWWALVVAGFIWMGVQMDKHPSPAPGHHAHLAP